MSGMAETLRECWMVALPMGDLLNAVPDDAWVLLAGPAAASSVQYGWL